MTTRFSLRLFLFLAAAIGLAGSLSAQLPREAEPLTPLPVRADLDTKPAAIGERLFNDVRLSRDLEQSCATCHPLDRGGMDGLRVAVLPGGEPHLRNTPTVFNVGFNAAYNWDGVTDTLEKHTERLLTTLMKISWPELLGRLQKDATYVASFRAAFPDGLTQSTVLRAITAFERSLVTPSSRFDRYLAGERAALTAREKQGYELFRRYGCVSCHQGVNIGGNVYQKFGVFEDVLAQGAQNVDPGRIRVTGVPRDERVFRVPSLRNVAVTAPYFHDGREPRLETAVETMVRAQLGRRLAADEINRIVDFLETLTGEYRGKSLVAPTQAQ
jgi:cytochrome c peroxidase